MGLTGESLGHLGRGLHPDTRHHGLRGKSQLDQLIHGLGQCRLDSFLSAISFAQPIEIAGQYRACLGQQPQFTPQLKTVHPGRAFLRAAGH